MNQNNFGIAKSIVLNKLTKDYTTNDIINESKSIAIDFFNVINESPVLQMEFEIYSNIEKKCIDNDSIAMRYLDENLKLFKDFTEKQINEAHGKLESFIDESFILIPENKKRLYESIDFLLNESVVKEANNSSQRNRIDLIHESYSNVLNYIKHNELVVEADDKKDEFILLESNIDLNHVVDLAMDKFNEKYSELLNEDEKSILHTLTFENDKSKTELFESLKATSLEKLNEMKLNDGIQDVVNSSIDKINEMSFKTDSVTKDIIDLYELKKNLG